MADDWPAPTSAELVTAASRATDRAFAVLRDFRNIYDNGGESFRRVRDDANAVIICWENLSEAVQQERERMRRARG